MQLFVADYYADHGDKDRAKQLYRDIITTYTGEAYKSYVKKAEFGLEDLKTVK
jgi:thiaminase